MDIAAYHSSDPEFLRARLNSDSEPVNVGSVPAYAVFQPDTVYLEFDPRSHEPVLVARGELARITAREKSDYDIRTLTMISGDDRVNVRYRFSNEQQQELVAKGLFTEGFEPPVETMTGAMWEIPTDVSLSVIEPASPDDPPIVGVDVPGLQSLETNQDESGYDMASMFEDQRYYNGVSVEDEDELDNGYGDLFADRELPEWERESRETAQPVPSTPRERLEHLIGDRLPTLSVPELRDVAHRVFGDEAEQVVEDDARPVEMGNKNFLLTAVSGVLDHAERSGDTTTPSPESDERNESSDSFDDVFESADSLDDVDIDNIDLDSPSLSGDIFDDLDADEAGVDDDDRDDEYEAEGAVDAEAGTDGDWTSVLDPDVDDNVARRRREERARRRREQREGQQETKERADEDFELDY